MEEIIRLNAGSAAVEKDRDPAGNDCTGDRVPAGNGFIGGRDPAGNGCRGGRDPAGNGFIGCRETSGNDCRGDRETSGNDFGERGIEGNEAGSLTGAKSPEGGRGETGKPADTAREPGTSDGDAVTGKALDVPAAGSSPENAASRETEEEDIAESRARKKREARRSAIIEEVVSWIKSFILMFAVALFLTQFIIINAVIPSGSMEDTIMTHDRLIGARFSYWFSEPARGDIVIFHYPVDEKKIYIKRIIGLPGETVRIEGGNIYIDDAEEPLQEGYLKEEWDVLNDGFEFHVPEGSYLMLGDNRNWSEDARYWAENAVFADLAETIEEAEPYTYVRKEKILGKAVFTYFRKFRILKHGEWYE